MSATATPGTAGDMHSVAGKVVIITGSGKGIGKGMALHLGKGGAQIVVAEWKDDLMSETCRELDDLGITNHGVVCDIQQRDQIEAMVAGDGRTVRPRRRARQQRADVPAARADRRLFPSATSTCSTTRV